MLRRFLTLAVVGISALALAPGNALAALSPQNADSVLSDQQGNSDHVQARTFRLSDTHVPGRLASDRQTVTAWAVTSGSWNGEILDGLSLVLVQNVPEAGPDRGTPTTHCYISHLATASQRSALINAFAASLAINPQSLTAWRIEPAVIRMQSAGRTLIVHLGLVG